MKATITHDGTIGTVTLDGHDISKAVSRVSVELGALESPRIRCDLVVYATDVSVDGDLVLNDIRILPALENALYQLLCERRAERAIRTGDARAAA